MPMKDIISFRKYTKKKGVEEGLRIKHDFYETLIQTVLQGIFFLSF